MSNWLGALLGTILIRVAIGGTVLTGMKFLWDGLYVLAAFVLVPFALFLLWEAWHAVGPNGASIDEPL